VERYGAGGGAGRVGPRALRRPREAAAGGSCGAIRGPRLTYGELAAASRRLAHHLRTLGLGPERLAAVCAGRTLERVVAILAVLQAGGAFVSLDPDYPPERLATILGEIEAPVLLTEEAISRRLPATRSAIVLLDREIPGSRPRRRPCRRAA